MNDPDSQNKALREFLMSDEYRKQFPLQEDSLSSRVGDIISSLVSMVAAFFCAVGSLIFFPLALLLEVLTDKNDIQK